MLLCISDIVGLDDIPSFIIKECSTVLELLLKHIFNLSVSQKHSPTQRKQAGIMPVYKKGNNACVQKYRPVTGSLGSNPENVDYVM
jgi:hypothetical protein